MVGGVEPPGGEVARLSPDTTTKRALPLTTLRRVARNVGSATSQPRRQRELHRCLPHIRCRALICCVLVTPSSECTAIAKARKQHSDLVCGGREFAGIVSPTGYHLHPGTSVPAVTTIKKSEPIYTIASPIGFRVTLLAADFSFTRPRSLIVVLRNVERTDGV